MKQARALPVPLSLFWPAHHRINSPDGQVARGKSRHAFGPTDWLPRCRTSKSTNPVLRAPARDREANGRQSTPSLRRCRPPPGSPFQPCRDHFGSFLRDLDSLRAARRDPDLQPLTIRAPASRCGRQGCAGWWRRNRFLGFRPMTRLGEGTSAGPIRPNVRWTGATNAGTIPRSPAS